MAGFNLATKVSGVTSGLSGAELSAKSFLKAETLYHKLHGAYLTDASGYSGLAPLLTFTTSNSTSNTDISVYSAKNTVSVAVFSNSKVCVLAKITDGLPLTKAYSNFVAPSLCSGLEANKVTGNRWVL